ncbi:hypothetical protein OHA40_13165 [Nocardia sp. NBC_00508]|uniref:hypothetical protein n=1 Tax=Nocardia sp. NBC_00508 TaxID=2975992 RepID=UPI002E81653C|nr:hypothetical protein [Nocardia sp. NBC_00508]WUD68980.1 hypothetical protein OHA40_13165 [Nocardia sp. NBC_00508]
MTRQLTTRRTVIATVALGDDVGTASERIDNVRAFTPRHAAPELPPHRTLANQVRSTLAPRMAPAERRAPASATHFAQEALA